MHLSSTIMEIWHLKHNWVTTLTFSGSCDVISHVTIRLAVGDFLCVVHCDHASILHRYGDIAPQLLDARIWTQKGERKEERERKKRKGKGEGKGEGKMK